MGMSLLFVELGYGHIPLAPVFLNDAVNGYGRGHLARALLITATSTACWHALLVAV